MRTPPYPALALVAALSAACSSGEAAPPVDLLSRAPDALSTQPGALVAAAGEAPFGDAARAGWEPAVPAAATPVAWSDGGTASLFLDATEPRARTVALRLASPSEPVPVTVRLNGVALGSFEAGATLGVHALDAPAAAWTRGRNVLELEAAFVHAGAGGAARGVGLAQVQWGPRVDGAWEPAARRVVLGPDAGAAWVLAGALDEVEVALAGEGADVEARLARLDPLRGGAQPLVSQRLVAGEDRIDLPAARPLVLELVNRGAGEVRVERLVARGADRDAPPPIVFVSVDTFSARHASVYGYPRATTPALEALAGEAVTFTAARANAPFTLTSYLSQFTGLYPSAHRPAALADGRAVDVEAHGVAWSLEHLDPGRLTLAEALRAGGYRTAAFVDNPWLDRDFGTEQGFDVYDASAARINQTDPDGGAAHVLPLARDWLAGLAPGDVPFLFLQVLDLHHPYLPVAPHDRAFEGDGLWDEAHALPVEDGPEAGYGTIPDLVARGAVRRGALPAVLRTAPIIASYDQKLRELDAHLGRLFDDLRARGLWDEALVVVSADHGEAMLEHDYLFNHGLLYDEHVHVPLLVKLPAGARAGTVVADDVQLVDLYPTLLELAGLGDVGAGTHGRSLVPLLEGRGQPAAATYAEGGVRHQRMLLADGWKLVETPTQAGVAHELYRLVDDPLELVDLAAEEPATVAALAARLATERARADAARMGDAALGAAGHLTDEEAAALRALGYAVDTD